MVNYDYKSAAYNRKVDGDDPTDLINAEATNNWEYYTAIRIYRHEWVFIFRRQQQA